MKSDTDTQLLDAPQVPFPFKRPKGVVTVSWIYRVLSGFWMLAGGGVFFYLQQGAQPLRYGDGTAMPRSPFMAAAFGIVVLAIYFFWLSGRYHARGRSAYLWLRGLNWVYLFGTIGVLAVSYGYSLVPMVRGLSKTSSTIGTLAYVALGFAAALALAPPVTTAIINRRQKIRDWFLS